MYDYIIIGSGHNALICAYYLSKKYKVLVLEKNQDFGGCVSTQELTLPGFYHDTCAMNLGLFAGSAFFQENQEELIQNGVEFVHCDKPFSSVFSDDSYCAVHQDTNKTLASIENFSAKDAKSWSALNDSFLNKVEHMLPIMSEEMPSFATFKHLYKGVRKNKMSWLYDIAEIFLSSSRDFSKKNFEHEKIQAMVSCWAMHLDFSPEVSGGALFSYLESFANQQFGMVIGKGGAKNIIDAMLKMLQKNEVVLQNNTIVTKIICKDKKAIGVQVGADILHAKKGVIANCNPQNIFTKMIDKNQLDAKFINKAEQFRPGVGTMMIHLALDALPQWKAGEELQSFAYIHLADSMDDIAMAYNQCQQGLLPTKPFMVVGQPSVVDNTRAPEGKHILWIQVRAVPAKITGDANNKITKTNWDDVKEQYADYLIDLIDARTTGFKTNILARKVFSPQDLENFNPNLVGGCNISGSHHLNQNLFMRPFAGYSRYKTPIKNLYMLGASTWPGAGVGGGSGRLLGKKLM